MAKDLLNLSVAPNLLHPLDTEAPVSSGYLCTPNHKYFLP